MPPKPIPGPDDANAGDVARDVRVCPKTKKAISLSYRVTGSLEGPDPVLVLINGLNANYYMYDDDFIGRIAAKGYTILQYDNRDAGHSTKLTEFGDPSLVKQLFPKCCCCCGVKQVYDLSDMADDLAALLDRLKIPKAHILGTSMGGMIAQRFALQHPHRCLSLTSMKSTTGAEDLPRPSFWHQRQLIAGPKQAEDDEQWAKNLARFLVEVMWPEGSINDPKKLEFCEGYVRKQVMYARYDGGNARQLTAIVQTEPRDAMLKELQVPTLVLHGELDALVPLSHGQRTHKCIPGSTFVVIKGMAHNFWPGHYDEMVAAIVDRMETAAPRGESQQQREAPPLAADGQKPSNGTAADRSYSLTEPLVEGEEAKNSRPTSAKATPQNNDDAQ